MISITLSFLLYTYKTHVKRKKSPCALYSARSCYTPQTAIIAIHKITVDCQKAKQINSENVVGWFPKLHKTDSPCNPSITEKIIGKATWGEVIITEYESNAIATFPVSKPESHIHHWNPYRSHRLSYRNRVQK